MLKPFTPVVKWIVARAHALAVSRDDSHVRLGHLQEAIVEQARLAVSVVNAKTEDLDEPEVSGVALADTRRVEWMEYMRRECEGHVLTRCFLPGDRTLREQVDEMMQLNEMKQLEPLPEGEQA